jgi:carbon monoxide dehydrogenase subunit G
MKTITTTATIDVPTTVEQVWALVSDVRRYSEWVEGTEEVTSGADTAAPGAVYTERNRLGPFITRSTWRVEELDRTRGTQAHVSDGSPPLRRMAVRIAIEPTEAGTRLALTLEADVAAGFVSGLLGRVLVRALARSNQRSVEAFRELAVRERGTASTPTP